MIHSSETERVSKGLENEIFDLTNRIKILERVLQDKNDSLKSKNDEINKLENGKKSLIEKIKEDHSHFENELAKRDDSFLLKLSKVEENYNRKKAILDVEIKKVLEEKKRYTEQYQEKLKTNSSEFVKTTVKDLNYKEKNLSKKASFWSILGAFVLSIGLISTIIVSFRDFGNINSVMSWPLLMFFTFKGVVILTVIGFFTRYDFVISGNYMQEALKVSNRIHAIKFGQFYIETYGATATWEEVKEVFATWSGEEKTNWEKNIKYDEFNKGIKALSAITEKFKKSDNGSDNGVNIKKENKDIECNE